MGYKKLVQYGNVVETFEYKYDLPRNTYRKPKRRNFGRVSPKRNRRPDNLRRLKRNFTKLVLCNVSQKSRGCWVTFSFDQVVDIRTGMFIASDFFNRLKKSYRELSYIAVAEFQKRGALHFHCLIWGLPDIIAKHERRYRRLQHFWSRGFLDCVQTYGTPEKLASYIAKYMYKGMHDERMLSFKAYMVSRNILRPVSLSLETPFEYLSEIVDVDNSLAKESYYDTLWLGSCHYKKYII